MGSIISVLYVEDDPGVFEATLLLLETVGYRVVSAQNLDDALRALERAEFEPDVIVTDHNLGHGALGMDVVHGVRRLCERTVPAIILTGDDWAQASGGPPAPACRVLRKPVDAPSLTMLIDQFGRGSGGR